MSTCLLQYKFYHSNKTFWIWMFYFCRGFARDKTLHFTLSWDQLCGPCLRYCCSYTEVKTTSTKIILNVFFGSMEEHHHSCDCLVSSCLLGPMDCLLNHYKCPRQYIFRFTNLTNLYWTKCLLILIKTK